MKHRRSFKWTEAVQALCLLFVKYAAHMRRNPKATQFEFTTALDPAHAHSLDVRLNKEKEAEKSNWIDHIFGSRDDQGHTPLFYLLGDAIGDHGRQPGPYGFRLHKAGLPLQNLVILEAGLPLTKVDRLDDLAAQIKGQWRKTSKTTKSTRRFGTKRIQKSTSRPPLRKKRKQSSLASPVKRTKAHKTSSRSPLQPEAPPLPETLLGREVLYEIPSSFEDQGLSTPAAIVPPATSATPVVPEEQHCAPSSLEPSPANQGEATDGKSMATKAELVIEPGSESIANGPTPANSEIIPETLVVEAKGGSAAVQAHPSPSQALILEPSFQSGNALATGALSDKAEEQVFQPLPDEAQLAKLFDGPPQQAAAPSVPKAPSPESAKAKPGLILRKRLPKRTINQKPKRPFSRLTPKARANVKSKAWYRAFMSVVGPCLDVFRQSSQDPSVIIRPTYTDVHLNLVTRLSKYRFPKAVKQHCLLVVGGTRGSGRTTVALQIAIDTIKLGGRSYYLDLNKVRPTPSPPLRFLFGRQEICVVVDNVHSNMPAAIQIYLDWKHTWKKGVGKVKLVFVSLWPFVFKPDLAQLLVCPTNEDFFNVFSFWRN